MNPGDLSLTKECKNVQSRDKIKWFDVKSVVCEMRVLLGKCVLQHILHIYINLNIFREEGLSVLCT